MLKRPPGKPFPYYVVPKLWPGATIVCIASGPSLTPEDVAACRDRARVIAINDNYRLAPWADVLYACDEKWWRWHKGVPSFTGLRFACERHARRWNVEILRDAGLTGLERDPAAGVRTGKNSGYQAINLAVHLGAARIVLLGYDMQRTNGADHWFGRHPQGTTNPYERWCRFFRTLAPELRALGIECINCSRQTALSCFPRMALTEALALPAKGAAA